MSAVRTPSRQAPTARRLLWGFFAFGGAFALVVVFAVGALLVKVRSDTEADVHRMLLSSAQTQLAQSTAQQSELLSQEVDTVTKAIQFLRDAAVQAYVNPVDPGVAETGRYTMRPDGAYITTSVDPDRPSMFYSGYVPIGEAERRKAARLSAVDPALVAVVNTNPLVAQAYVNTWDSLNRIYPGFDVLSQYPPKMDIPSYNFYYLADAAHNPDRGAVWTNVYVDPAGQGWMTSVIAPVYVGDRLEAVVGIDITVSSLVGQLLSNPQAFDAYSLLIDSHGTIMAMPAAAEQTFGLKELTDVDYATFVNEDTFKPEQFDIALRPDTVSLNRLVNSAPSGDGEAMVGQERTVVAWQSLPPMGWRVVSIVPSTSVQGLDEPSHRLRDAAGTVFWIVSVGFALMILGLTWRARKLSLAFTRPLEEIDIATARIAGGDFLPELPPAPVAELDRTGRQLLSMGASLQQAQQRMMDDAQRLRSGEQRYRAIFENVAEPVMTVDAHGVIVDANDAAHDAFGDDLPGTSVVAVLGDDSFRTAGRWTVQLGDDFLRRTFELAVGSSGEGDNTLYTITAHDVTATVLARGLLEEASATAQHTARLKDEFLASMSHEIRTPLNGVVGVLSLLADRPLPEEARHELSVARRSADDLLVLVNDVLDFAKIEAGQVSVVTRHVRLLDVIEGVRQLYTPFAEEQRNALVLDLDPTVPEWVQLDPTRVRQVLMNLVNNALKFTQDGTVTITVRREPAPADGHFVLRFTVTDTGVGVETELQDRLFTRFTQGDPLNARRFPGTGLGLAIVKRLVELMGGEVGLDSELGQGSRFWFTVESMPGVPSSDVGGLPAGFGVDPIGALRVLVAEDNDVNRFLIIAALERLGHSVHAVVNGREAVEAVQRERFDVVMMDVQMPVANGIDATRAIRALPGAVGKVPIVAVTANVLPEQQALYQKVGFTDWLPKPLTLDQVDRTLRRMFSTGQGTPVGQHVSTSPAEGSIVNELAVFDSELVAKHRALFGPTGVDKLIATFESSLAERRAELEAFYAVGDLDGVRRVGHTIKGMAGSVGARRLWAAGERVQHASDEHLPALVEALSMEADKALAGVDGAWRG